MTLKDDKSPVSAPAEAGQSHPRRWWIMLVLCLCLEMVSIDNTIVSVALPTITLKLSASASELQWIVEAYSLVLAGLLLTSGALTDRFGSQRTLLVGMGVFAWASLVSAFAATALQLIVARALMGLGGALIMPSTLSIVRNIFSAQERPRAIALWAAVASVGIVIGPLAGGWLLEHFWWGSIFLVNLPIALVASLGVWQIVPNLRFPRPGPLDLFGTFLSIGGIVSLVYGIVEAPTLGWFHPLILLSLAGAVLLLAAFTIWELKVAHPMLDLRLFRNPRFSAAGLSVALAYFALFGALFFLTQHLQLVLGFSPLEAGLGLIPLSVGVGVGAVLGSWLTPRLGSKLLVAGGLAVTAAGLALFSTVSPTSGYGLVAVVLLTVAGGIGLAAPAATDSIMGAVPNHQSGAAAGIDEIALELGGALGVAVLGSLLASGYTTALSQSPELPAQAQPALESIGAAAQLAAEIGGSTGQVLLDLSRRAFIESLGNTVLIGAGITLIGALVALVFLPAFAFKSSSEPSEE